MGYYLYCSFHVHWKHFFLSNQRLQPQRLLLFLAEIHIILQNFKINRLKKIHIQLFHNQRVMKPSNSFQNGIIERKFLKKIFKKRLVAISCTRHWKGFRAQRSVLFIYFWKSIEWLIYTQMFNQLGPSPIVREMGSVSWGSNAH